MSLFDHFKGQDSEEEYSPAVKAVRDAKAAELDEKSRINRMKRYFRKENPVDEVEEIASFEEPEIESTEPKPTIKSCIKTGVAYTKEGILNKRKKIREYWESIGDTPVMQPTYVAIEPEAVHDEESREKVHETLSKSSKQKIPVTSNSLSTKKARKAHLKRLQEAAYNKARAERKDKDEAEAERRAIAKGTYCGSTTVRERTVHRAKRVGKGAKRAASVIQDVANKLRETHIGYEPRKVQRKINGRLKYTDSNTRTKKRSFSPARQISGPIRKKETLNVHKASPMSRSSHKGSPASPKVKGGPSTHKGNFSPASFKNSFSPSSGKSKSGPVTGKSKFTGVGKPNKTRPSFL